jgi:hypothetical protein
MDGRELWTLHYTIEPDANRHLPIWIRPQDNIGNERVSNPLYAEYPISYPLRHFKLRMAFGKI